LQPLLERPQPDINEYQPESTCSFSIIFIGSLVHPKGVDILLNSLSLLKNFAWNLTIVGDGPYRLKLDSILKDLGLSGRVKFAGNLKHQKAMEILVTADLLVLPSRGDGWGAVVNEALMRGVPVICSDTCGAKDLLADTHWGAVFKSESVDGLRSCLNEWLTKGKRSCQDRQELKEWSQCISGECAAEYVLRVIDCVYHGAPRPVAPWLCK